MLLHIRHSRLQPENVHEMFLIRLDSFRSVRTLTHTHRTIAHKIGSPNWQPTLKRRIEWKRIELYSNGENRNGKVLFFRSALDRWLQRNSNQTICQYRPTERLIVRSTLNMKLHKAIFVLQRKSIEREKCRYRKIVHGTDWRQIKVRHFCLRWLVVVIRSLFYTLVFQVKMQKQNRKQRANERREEKK